MKFYTQTHQQYCGGITWNYVDTHPEACHQGHHLPSLGTLIADTKDGYHAQAKESARLPGGDALLSLCFPLRAPRLSLR